MSNVTLKGVTVLSGWVIGVNVSLPPIVNVIDGERDIDAFLIVALPFAFMWLVGLAYGVYRTDDDGYVYGRRSIESKSPLRRIAASVLVYLLEGLQLIGLSFGRDSCSVLMGGAAFLGFSRIVLWMGPIGLSFGICATAQLVMLLFFIVPLVLWLTIKREKFNRFATWFISGNFGMVTSFIQDCFLYYLTIPIMVQLIRAIPCTYYASGEPATAMDGAVLCGSYTHQVNAVAGGFIFILSFCVGIIAGTVPALVARCDDMALNGRFASVSFAIKALLAVVYVVAAERHRYYHVAFTLACQMMLLFISYSMRPCLVERVNFHRSIAYALPVVTTGMGIVSVGLDDVLSPVAVSVGSTFFFLVIVMALLKYYFLVCHKLFPRVDFENGEYEGDLSLGFDVPHGHGVLTWPKDDRMFTGNFFYGKVHGYGMLTFAKVFYQGDHQDGQRHGFGMTNIMENEEEESYEGFWMFDIPHGQGTKKFVDGDVFDGTFCDGLENGTGKWTFTSSMGKETVVGTWVNGIFTGVVLDEDQEYQGEIRYGVPHGEGTMTIEDDMFEGEWRAGKMHGFGRVQMAEGSYEGHFIDGLYSDDGIWSDQTGVYSGKFLLGLKHGHGREETEDGVFEGTFEEGCREGYGTFTYHSGAIYQGSWKRNEYHGTGLLVTSDYEYDGMWFQGRKHGNRGHITFSTGIEYIGGWIDDQFHGEGRLRIPAVGEYEGKFSSGNRVGLGKMLLFDGSEYVGEWDLDLPHGSGQFTFTSMKSIHMLSTMEAPDASAVAKQPPFMQFGGEYVGTFADGEMKGFATLVGQDGSRYEGEFDANLPNGHGTIVYAMGGQYDGEWSAGERQGHGKMQYADNRVYVGEWVAGRRHGHGELFGATGELIHECEWIGDVPVQRREIHGEDELIPTVDVEEFLREIMPAAISPTEIEESRMRKRLELEEIYFRVRIPITLDEEVSLLRVFKHFVTMQHFAIRAKIVKEQQEEHDDLLRVTLAKVLNLWKAEFKIKHDRDPKKSDLLSDLAIAPVYKTYMELSSKRQGESSST